LEATLSTPARRKKRFLAGFLAAVLAVSVMPLAGTAQAEVLEPAAPGGFCEHAPTENPFPDVSATDPALAEIICQAAEEVGISIGFPDGTFRPNASTTRRQMALFMVRLADLLKAQETTAGTLTALPPYDGVNQFDDSAAESAEVREAINRLADAGIVQGTAPGTYSPAENVTRRHMLLFIVRLIEFVTGAALPEGAGAGFPDQPAQTPEVQAATNKLFEAKVVEGKADGTFGYGDDVNRRQMTWFNMRTAELHLQRGLVTSPFPPPPPPTNQAFTVTPEGPAFATVSTAPGTEHAARGHRQYTVATTGPISIALIPDPNVRVDANRIATFRDDDNNLRPDGLGLTNARIEVVNGVVRSTTDGDDIVHNVSPIGGQVTFVINSQTPNTLVRPVVWTDTAPLTELQLDTATCTLDQAVVPAERFCAPAEAFGVGGTKLYIAPEATLGAHSAQAVVIPVTVVNFFTAVGTAGADAGVHRTFNYDEVDDRFFYNTSACSGFAGQFTNLPLTLAQFEAHLSALSTQVNLAGLNLATRPDTLNVQYNPGGISVFTIVCDRPLPPTGVTATTMALGGDGVANDIRVTWTAPANLDVTGYRVFRAPVSAAGVVGTFALVGTTTGRTATTFDHLNVAPGQHAYAVLAENAYSTSTNSGVAQAAVAAPPPPALVAVPTPPAAHGITVADADPAGFMGSGDSVTVTFNEPMAAPAAGATVRFQDGDGTVVEVTNGANATFTRSGADNNVITVTLTAVPTTIAAGTTPGLAYASAFVADASGVTDAAGALWNAAVASPNIGGAACTVPLGVITVPGTTPNVPFTPTTTADATCSTGTITLSAATDTLTGAAGSVAPGARIRVTATTGTTVTVGATVTAAADGSFTLAVPGTDPPPAGDNVTIVQEVQRTATTWFTSATVVVAATT
jgi:hypothetical protein